MKQIQLFLPKRYIEALDELVLRKLYPSRAEAIRFAVLDLIRFHEGFTVEK